ncbi:unnamed protein product [Caenorhabditis auriculariae]|uniref:Eukaryotic translation initiation factor 3 30 kDa subunit n=1 Tax=Caenorhabditis auriculariae TaxID=2777116 RepID=A0A8S1GSF7_9PELO|nr:unnamed protein product [Caenorhabditis auriculariae]
MGDNWDDDDFEPEVSSLAPPPAPEPVAPTPQTTTAAPKKKAPTFQMESLGRELSAAEREEMQRQQDLSLARELFEGEGEDQPRLYSEIVSKEEFELWGEKVGQFLHTRHKAANYGFLLSKLFVELTDNMEAVDIRKMSNHLKAIADAKKTEVKQPKPGTTAAVKSKKKAPQLKANKGANNLYDDYGGDDAAAAYDDYDDFM